MSILWWPEVELNHRHTDFQSVALPTELSGPLKRGFCSITWSSTTAVRKEGPGAVGESWTPTRFLSHDSESCMSTNSITTAYWYYWVFSRKCFFSSLLHPKNIRKKVSKLRPLHHTNSQITDTFKDTFKETP